jgi:hypothetical protein
VRADEEYRVRDLLTGQVFHWRGGATWVSLDPAVEPAHVLVLEHSASYPEP